MHIYEEAADEIPDAVYGSELRVIDVAGDEVSDDRWHSVCRGRVINTILDPGGEEKLTLNIEKDVVLLEVWPLKHTLQFRDVLLSEWGHCLNPPSAHRHFIYPGTYIVYHHR